eukprot:144948_1
MSDDHGIYKHDSVKLQCPFLSADNSITVKLQSDDDWEANLNLIIKAIQNTFKPISDLKESEWVLTANDAILNKHDALQFAETLSTQIPPQAVLQVSPLNMTLDSLIKMYNQSQTLSHKLNIPSSPSHNRPQSSVDINQATDAMIDDMSEHDIYSLEKIVSNAVDHNDFKMSWNHVIACIKHEMWPTLGSVIQALLRNKNKVIGQYDLSRVCIDNVINILKKKQLASEECHYLEQLILRAKEFDPNESKYQRVDPSDNNAHRDGTDVYYKGGMSASLLMDIHNVHKIFVFANFNFAEYTMLDFKSDITKALGQKFCETHASYRDRLLDPRFHLYPPYIIDDNMFRVFDYYFGVSLFVNTLKCDLFIQKNAYFEVRCIVMPQSVSSVYDSQMIFDNYNPIDTMEHYLSHKGINIKSDFYKIRFKTDAPKNPMNIANKIEELYDAEDIVHNETTKLMIIIDRRVSQQTKHDSAYIFSYQNNDRFSELETNYFLCMQFKIVRNTEESDHKNKVVTYFRYGLNGMTRFFPEMLVSIIPRLFRTPHDLAPSHYLAQIYHNTFKNGWCVTLEDTNFDKYYKIITTFTHVSVNYNRHVLHDQFYKKKPMLCFMDLLYHELESRNHFSSNDIQELDSFFDDNEYCTESIVDDILMRSHEVDRNIQSNIQVSMISERKRNQFDIIKTIVGKYNPPCHVENTQICAHDHVFDVDKCSFIQIIIDGLKQFNQSNHQMDDMNVIISDLLGAYDHMVSVHGFWSSESLSDTSDALSKPFEDMDHAQYISKTHKYIVQRVGGHCQAKACPILQKHCMRRREREKNGTIEDQKDDDHESGVDEILAATLNALHCYILHEKKELFRLHREHGASHYIIAPMIDETEIQNMEKEQSDDKTSSNTMRKLNYGVSVLQWLEHSEHATFDGFRDEITQHPESTIDTKTFLIYAQECYIKMNQRKYAQYLLDELMALKIYTDTNIFQSILRQAYWKSSTKERKKSFYNWALLLFKTALFHSKPIPQAFRSKAPRKLFHGLNQVFVLNDGRPKYNGPTSTTLARSVAHSFSEGIGLLLSIAPSYANKFKFITGICVAWISHHKHEEEVFLMDQYLPITSAHNFDTDPKNNVDHLMYTVKSYTKDILNRGNFYAILGVYFVESWLPFIQAHHLLFDPIDKDRNVRVLDILVKDLGMKALYHKHKLLSSTFELVRERSYKMLSCGLFRLNLNHEYTENVTDCHFEDAEYKIIFDENDDDTLITWQNRSTSVDLVSSIRTKIYETIARIP